MSDTIHESKPTRRGRPRIEAGDLFDRPPPHHIDAERSLLGSIMLEPMVLTEVVQIVPSAEMFYKEAHGVIYQCLVDTFESNQKGDLVLLAEALRARGMFEQVGGSEALMDLTRGVPSSASAPYYAKLIADASRLRRLIDASGEIMYEAYTQGGGTPGAAKQVIDQAEKKIFDIASEDVNAEPESLKELLIAEMTRIDEAEGHAISGLSTGFDDLDDLLSGFQDEEMIILAARPSMGKTAIALNIAEQIAFGGATPWQPRAGADPVPVGVFSLEMARGSLTQRLLSARSGVDASKLRTGKVNDEEWERLTRASGELADAPIFIDDTPGMTVLTMRAKARRMKNRHDIRCIVVDYLQLLTSPTQARESRQVEVSEISRSIKALARELRVPVLCLAQLNRGAEQREGNRPRMSDLRESGSIEQDADVVMLLHREAYYHRGDPDWDINNPELQDHERKELQERLNTAELIIAKQRNGPTDTVKLLWDNKTVRFKSFDPMRSHSQYGYAGEIADPLAPDFAPRPDATGPNHGYDGPRAPFAPGTRSGPEADFRDGSGDDVSFDDDETPG